MEDANAGTGLIQEFRKAGPFRLIRCRPCNSKVERLIAQTGQIDEGRVYLPAQLDGLDNLLANCARSPTADMTTSSTASARGSNILSITGATPRQSSPPEADRSDSCACQSVRPYRHCPNG